MTLREVSPTPEPLPEEPPRPKAISRGKVLRWLKATQKYSAYGVLAFAGLHLTPTVLLPPFSLPAADSAFMAARSIYQSTIGEKTLVYGMFGAHVLSGLIIRAVRISLQYTDFDKIGFGRATAVSYSGLLLAAMVPLHFIATRYGPSVALGDSSLISLEYITFSLSKEFAQVAGFLGLMTSAFAYHTVDGLDQYLSLRLRRITKYAIVATAVALASKSLSNLATQPVPTGWLAEQYERAEVAAHQYI